jgi:hypothetical protein
VDSGGRWTFRDTGITDCQAATSSDASHLEAIMGVRRHLGWIPGLVLHPDPATTVDRLIHVAEETAVLAGTSSAPHALVPHSTGEITNRIVFKTLASPANFVLRLTTDGARTRAEFSRRLPDPAQPQLSALIQPNGTSHCRSPGSHFGAGSPAPIDYTQQP